MALLVLSIAAVAPATAVRAAAVSAVPHDTTAWHHGHFAVDVPGVVERSDVVLTGPNWYPYQSMPLGNGRLGAAVWSANGLTAQLNRGDTITAGNGLRSPGQLVVPGLSTLTSAADYTGHLNLYNGQFTESGNGMTATVFIRKNSPELVVQVNGANPNTTQTATINLWQPRQPLAATNGTIATLAETWVDNGTYGGSGKTFGAMAALTAGGRDVVASVVNPLTVQVSFKPNPDGSFRIVVASPAWTGGNALATATTLLAGVAARSQTALSAGHLRWWHDFWAHVGLMKLTSAHGAAQYMENLRLIGLYAAAGDSGTSIPSTHGGAADLYSFSQDNYLFGSLNWNWNQEMQVAANLGAGAAALNKPYFNLYQSNLRAIEAWTQQHMGGLPGVCVPETIRFNGSGYYFPTSASNASCDAQIPPSYNARSISTGASIGVWIWRQYLYTRSIKFLQQNYPVMEEAARFLLAYATRGPGGHLHDYPANALENQWDVHDPTNVIAGMGALFPAVISAATVLGSHNHPVNPNLVGQLKRAIPHILPYPRASAANETQLVPSSSDVAGNDVIAESYDPAAPNHNFQNPGLYPVWPYELIGNHGSLTSLARRTFVDRPNVLGHDWSADPIDAARLGLGSAVQSSLVGLTEDFQSFPSGLASFSGFTPSFGALGQPLSEFNGVISTALQQALVQENNGLLQIAPAWPSGWSAAATVYIRGGSKVDVQVQNGVPTTVAIQAGSTGTISIRNPWPGQQAEVVSGSSERGPALAGPTAGSVLSLRIQRGHTYLVGRTAVPYTEMPFAPVSGHPASSVKHLGARTIGVLPTPPPPSCINPTGSGPLINWIPQSGNTITDSSSYGRNAVAVGGGEYSVNP
ncbi:MAG: DUF5703 domain-containing protein, partial [Candidatus Dormibacteria bacterium]